MVCVPGRGYNSGRFPEANTTRPFTEHRTPRGRPTPMTPPLNRREFLGQAGLATTALAAAAQATPARADADAGRTELPASLADKVTLGKTGIKVSLVGMGTGSHGSGQ